MRRNLERFLLAVWMTGAAAGAFAAERPDALSPATSGGLELVDRNLAAIEVHARLLIVGAHPDDEDTSLLAWVVRGMGGEAAYLSLSRGEGGQNLIGSDLGVALGLLRTRELENARRTDGARQFFTRAYDFGYTTSLEETLRRWPREALVEDAVRVVRRFRPQVVVSVFPADGGGGHGQHQLAGIVAHAAFSAAGDLAAVASLWEEGSPAWAPAALYRSAWFDRNAATQTVHTGALDPWTGQSVHQIAMASRGQHRSQDMGRILELGPKETRLTWVAGAGGAQGDNPFAGVDTRLRSMARVLPPSRWVHEIEGRLAKVEALARAAREKLAAHRSRAALEATTEVVLTLRSIERAVSQRFDGGAARPFLDLLAEKDAAAAAALAGLAGVVIDAVAEAPTLTPGEAAKFQVTVWNGGAETVRVDSLAIDAAPGIEVHAAPPGGQDLRGGELSQWPFDAVLTGPPTRSVPYFLRRPRVGDLYDWSDAAPALRGEPFDPAPMVARVSLRVGEATFAIEREVVWRRNDQALGERRAPLRVVPRVEVSLDRELMVAALADSRPPSIEVALSSNSATAISGRLEIEVPAGWANLPPVAVALPPRARELRRLELVPAPDRQPGRGSVRVRFVSEAGERFESAVAQLGADHVPPVGRPLDAETALVDVDLVWPRELRVGYVRGASDRVPEALQQAGLELEILAEQVLRHASAADLARFDAIVLGSRAYESEPALGAAQGRLRQYVENGGLLIVQYQQYPFLDGRFAMVPFTIARPHDRVTDESAPVRWLDPRHPAARVPNLLGEADWSGWVQERGLYFARDWDAAYTPLLEIGSGAQALRGGLLVAKLGQGTYVYTGLAFFRQLPAGVPGAFRLFANLLGLGEARGRAPGGSAVGPHGSR
jgi:LmbE family N-acetylglucosaminyl deacetylase